MFLIFGDTGTAPLRWTRDHGARDAHEAVVPCPARRPLRLRATPRRPASSACRDHSLSRLAKDLGVADQTLRNGVRHAEVDGGLREALAPSERGGAPAAERGAHAAPRAGDPEKSRSLLRQRARRDPLAACAFVAAEQEHFPVATLCRVLGVSRSGSDAWRKRPPSARARTNQELTRHIRAVHELQSWPLRRAAHPGRTAGPRCGVLPHATRDPDERSGVAPHTSARPDRQRDCSGRNRLDTR
jgi:transposase-like protein